MICVVVQRVVDELKIYRGDDIRITDDIIIHNPTLNDIVKIGEKKFLSFCQDFTAHHLDSPYIVLLTDLGVDFTTISDWDLFVCLSLVFDENICNFLFGNLDFKSMKPYVNGDVKGICNKDGILVTPEIHAKMVGCIRKFANIPTPQYQKILDNPTQKNMAINSARREIESAKRREMFYPSGSALLPIMSSVVNYAGCNYTNKTIFNMNLYAFWDTVKRIQAYDNASHLFSGIYSGCIDLSKNKKLKEELNWMRSFR